jgi:hypothetical protein
MRGDQLTRQWRVIRAIEASPNGLAVAEIARPDGAQGIARKRSPSKACSKSWNGLFCYGGPKPVVSLILFLNGRA